MSELDKQSVNAIDAQIKKRPIPILKLVVYIVDRKLCKKLLQISEDHGIMMQFVCNATGTAGSETMTLLGLGEKDKSIVICLEPHFRIVPTMKAISEGLELKKPGSGIAFTIPLSGVSSPITQLFPEHEQQIKERLSDKMKEELAKMKEGINHDLVVAVINQGFSDELMEAAKEAGATGGTIIHARRTGSEGAMQFLGISVQAEKEIVAILTPKEQRKEIMQAINHSCGIRSEAQGFVFSLPVDSVEGLSITEMHNL